MHTVCAIIKLQREGQTTLEEKETNTMTFALYTDAEGYIGEVTSPSREAAIKFLLELDYEPGTFELRELIEE